MIIWKKIWVVEKEKHIFLAVADSIGHGVPGEESKMPIGWHTREIPPSSDEFAVKTQFLIIGLPP